MPKVQLCAGRARAINLCIFLQLNLPRTAGKSNTVTSRTLSTKVSSWRHLNLVRDCVHDHFLQLYSCVYTPLSECTSRYMLYTAVPGTVVYRSKFSIVRTSEYSL